VHNRGKNVKEHRFVNHSEEYAKGNMHVNIHRSVPDGLGGRTYYMTKSRYVDGAFICDQKEHIQ